jgi:hypothetical protein
MQSIHSMDTLQECEAWHVCVDRPRLFPKPGGCLTIMLGCSGCQSLRAQRGNPGSGRHAWVGRSNFWIAASASPPPNDGEGGRMAAGWVVPCCRHCERSAAIQGFDLLCPGMRQTSGLPRRLRLLAMTAKGGVAAGWVAPFCRHCERSAAIQGGLGCRVIFACQSYSGGVPGSGVRAEVPGFARQAPHAGPTGRAQSGGHRITPVRFGLRHFNQT